MMTDNAATPSVSSRLKNDLQEILYDRETLQVRVEELGAEISRDYPDGDLLLIGVLKGAIYFLSDLSRAISTPHAIDFMGASSYAGGTETSGIVKVTKDLDTDVRGKHLIIVEDIYDTGHTMELLRDLLFTHAPGSVRLCSLLSKQKEHKYTMKIDYVGFQIEDVFVVGYGLDYDEQYRHLECVGVLKPEIYENR